MDGALTLEDTRSCTTGCPGSKSTMGPFPFSPSTASWDGIFEASDLCKDKVAVPRPNANEVKKALFLSLDQGDRSTDTSSSYASLYLDSVAKLLYPSHLKILEAKVALNSGKSHLNSRGKVRMARKLRTPCSFNCKRCETPRLTDIERQTIFKIFWSLSKHELQWKFISDSVQVTPPKRKSATKGMNREKKLIRSYYFTVKDTTRKVCKTMFKNTLCICDSWIDSALSHSCDGTYVPDMRGKIHVYKTLTEQLNFKIKKK